MVAHYRVVTSCPDSARGWNADQFGRRLAAGSQYGRPLVGWCGPESVGSTGVVGTLLGPEGADSLSSLACGPGGGGGSVHLVRGLLDPTPPRCTARAGGVVCGGDWLVVENCTVDASIF